MEYALRNMDPGEFRDIFRRMKKDFPHGGYAPYRVLYEQLRDGSQSGMILRVGSEDAGYAICAAGAANGYVLLSYLSVYPEFRGKRFGLAFLEEIKKTYSGKQGIIVEVEKPENAETEQEKAVCEKRLSFYAKAGFLLVPDIDYTIWDASMHLMALPCAASFDRIRCGIEDIIGGIYLKIMGERYMHKLTIKIRR